jgi:hypothetical protein
MCMQICFLWLLRFYTVELRVSALHESFNQQRAHWGGLRPLVCQQLRGVRCVVVDMHLSKLSQEIAHYIWDIA